VTPDLIQLLRDLVTIPSINPMGDPNPGPGCTETRLTDFLQGLLAKWGLPWQRVPVEPGRDNLIARLDGEPAVADGGQLLLFTAHQDTVPVGGMTVEPFAAAISGDRLYGRGACDVKGGMAAMLWALARLARERPTPRPTLIMACTVNEEFGFSGAKSLAAMWDPPGGIIPRVPDAALVAEPTGLDVVVAHKGVLRWRLHTHGRAAHSSRPEAGDNAIYRMARVVQSLERYHREVLGSKEADPLCGPATLSVGTIRGGISVNVVPEHSTVEVDRRLMPDENPEEAYRQAIDYVAPRSATGDAPQHDPPFLVARPLSHGRNRAVGERLAAVAAEVSGRCRQVGVSYATDAACFAAAGVPSVVFGPGSIEQAHTADEWIALDQLDQAAEILFRMGRQPL
jgi:acetylornithine deacetylase/succinyl-diaminopimelate desuccinylase family protein